MYSGWIMLCPLNFIARCFTLNYAYFEIKTICLDRTYVYIFKRRSRWRPVITVKVYCKLLRRLLLFFFFLLVYSTRVVYRIYDASKRRLVY